MATVPTLSHWFDEGVQRKHTLMVIVVDTFDYTSCPRYFDDEDKARELVRSPGNMQRVEEVYDLTADKQTQLRKHRAWALQERQAS